MSNLSITSHWRLLKIGQSWSIKSSGGGPSARPRVQQDISLSFRLLRRSRNCLYPLTASVPNLQNANVAPRKAAPATRGLDQYIALDDARMTIFLAIMTASIAPLDPANLLDVITRGADLDVADLHSGPRAETASPTLVHPPHFFSYAGPMSPTTERNCDDERGWRDLRVAPCVCARLRSLALSYFGRLSDLTQTPGCVAWRGFPAGQGRRRRVKCRHGDSAGTLLGPALRGQNIAAATADKGHVRDEWRRGGVGEPDTTSVPSQRPQRRRERLCYFS